MMFLNVRTTGRISAALAATMMLLGVSACSGNASSTSDEVGSGATGQTTTTSGAEPTP